MNRELEAEFHARIARYGGGFLQPEHVACVFAILRDHFTRPARGKVEEPCGANRFLVGAMGSDVAILGLEMSLRRADALNLVTWITLVAAFSDDELEAARILAVEGDR